MDADRQWLWPNLPYLLSAHGEERVGRYGGVDPGKGVDNDFAAVLIRPMLPATMLPGNGGDQPVADFASSPLVSAEWYSVGLIDIDRASVMHFARSDEFTATVGRDDLSGSAYSDSI